MKFIRLYSIIIFWALFDSILGLKTRPYQNWNLTKPENGSTIIPEMPQDIPNNEVLYLLKRSFRNSSIRLQDNLKFKINVPQLYKNYMINTTISIVPYHWESKFNISVNLTNAYPDVPNYFNNDDRLNMNLKEGMESNKEFQCPFPSCKYSLIILSNRNETRSSIIAYNSNGDMTNSVAVTLITKPGIKKIGITESIVQNYLYPIIKWCVDKIPDGQIASGRFYAEAELNTTYSDQDINFYLNYVRAMYEKEPKTDATWENIRISNPDEKNMYVFMSNPKDITTDDLDKSSFNSKSTMSKMDELLGTQNCKFVCSIHGICLNGVCKCEEGYTGVSCSDKVTAYLFKEQAKDNLLARSLSLKSLEPTPPKYEDLKSVTGNPNVTGQKTHPCYSKGYLDYAKNVVGIGNYELCKMLISTLFFDPNCVETDPNCYKSITKKQKVNFNSTESIYVGKSYERIGQMLNISEISYSDYEKKTKWFCEIPFENLTEIVSPNDYFMNDVAKECFNMVYQLQILKSLSFPDEAIINFSNQEGDMITSMKWEISALVAEDSLKLDTVKTLNISVLVLGFLAIIFYILMRSQNFRKKLLKTCDPCIRKAKSRERADLANKEADYFINNDLEKMNKSAVNIPAKKRQFVERKIEQKIVKYVFAPLEFLCLLLFLLGIYHLVAFLSNSVEAFLILAVLSFSFILCGALDIENDILAHEEPYITVKNTKMHKEDVKLFMKLLENEDNMDDDCNLENALLRIDDIK